MFTGWPGDRIELVAAQRPVEGVADVEAVDVPVAGPAEVDARRPRAAAKTPTGSGRTRKSFVSNLKLGLVAVVVEADLRRVAGPDEVLPVVVGDDRVLLAVVERVEQAVGVLLRLVEARSG